MPNSIDVEETDFGTIAAYLRRLARQAHIKRYGKDITINPKHRYWDF